MDSDRKNASGVAVKESCLDSDSTPPRPHRFRILVVDDSPNSARVFSMMLELMGHEVQFATTGQAALELLETYAANVVISDIGMDQMDGFELAARIKALGSSRNLVLVVYSGHNDSRHRKDAMDAGFDFFIPKPAEPKTLRPLFDQIASRLGSC